MANKKESKKHVEKMKIGILTFHRAHNYGAVLQCYALQEVINEMGYDVEVIDYRPKYLSKPYKVVDFHRVSSSNPLKVLKRIIKETLLIAKRVRRYSAFCQFIHSRLNLSAEIKGNCIPSNYDVYIMGSDQIWNPTITKGFDPVFFGWFSFKKGYRKYVAYAASMEACELSADATDFYKESLGNFDSISVRETQLVNLLQPLTGEIVENVLDPTLLVDSQKWNQIAIQPDIKKKYVLVYQVRRNKNVLKMADKIAASIGAVVVEVTAELYLSLNRNNIQCASPEQFTGWIKYASCVVTTSFHGTAFSIIFNRPFYCIKLGDGKDSRSASLLSQVGLKGRMINLHDCPPIYSEIDYDEAVSKLLEMRNKSTEYLINALLR